MKSSQSRHPSNVFPFKLYIRRDAKEAVLAEDYFYETVFEGKHVTIYLKAGFDFKSSHPRLFFRVIGPPVLGRFAQASLVHDWLYVEHKCHVQGQLVEVTRKFADDLFKHQMLADGVSQLKASLMHKAVRAFGSQAWRT